MNPFRNWLRFRSSDRRGAGAGGRALKQRPRRFPRPLVAERLEDRTLLSVSFTPGPYSVPPLRSEIGQGQVASNFRPIEPFVSLNPGDLGNLAVSQQTGLELSTNAGATFPNSRTFPISGSYSQGGDTDTVFDHQGRLFWTNLSNVSPPGRLTVYITQLNPTTGAQIGTTHAVATPPVGSADDKEFLAVDRNNDLYVSWTRFDASNNTTILLSRSTDQGQTWSSSPVTVSGSGEGYVSFSTLAVAPNGDVYVAYHSEPGNTPTGTVTGNGQVFVARYRNDLSARLSKTNAFVPGAAVRRSSYAGTTFDDRGSAEPWVLADPSRPADVYVVTINDPSHGGSGDPVDLMYARSTDNGSTWTRSTLESGPSSSNSLELFPTAAIDAFGDIAVAWYDNRAGLRNSSNNWLFDVYGKYSTDGGQTWSSAFEINSSTNHFDTQNLSRIDDYFGITLYGGTAYVAWNGNSFDQFGRVTGQQVWFKSFAISGSLQVFGTPGNDQITIENVAGDPTFVEVLVNGQRQYAGLWSALSGITVQPGSGNDTISIENTFFGVPVTVTCGGGNDTINISPAARNLGNIQGIVTVNGATSGVDNLNIFDSNTSASNQAYSLSASSVARGGSAAINFNNLVDNVVLNGGTGADTYTVLGTNSFSTTTVHTGGGSDTVNVRSTTRPLIVNGDAGQPTVNVGSQAPNLNGTLAAITAPVTVTNTSGGALNVDDSGDSTSRSGTVSASSVTGLGMGSGAAINYTGSQLTSLTVRGGSGGDTFTVTGTSTATTIHPGGGTVNVKAAASALTIDGDGTNAPTVNVGSQAPNLNGTLAAITAPVTVTNTSGGALNVDDSGDSTARTGTISASSITGAGLGAGGAINYTGGSFQLASLTVRGGSGGNTWNVTGASTATTLHTGPGGGNASIANVRAVAASLTVDGDNAPVTVNVGSQAPNLNGTLANITAPVTVTNTSAPTSSLTVDDSGDNTGRTATITGTAVSGLGLGTGGVINYTGSQLASLTARGGSGGNIWNVTGTSTATTLHTGPGGGNASTVNVQAAAAALTIDGDNAPVTVNVGSQAPALNGTLTGITGAVTVTNTFTTSTLSLDDSGDGTGRTGAITGTAVTGLGMPSGVAVNYTGSQLSSLTVRTGSVAAVTASGTSTSTSVIGNASGTNTLVGPNAATTWNVTGSNAGNLAGLNLAFSGFQNLTGGASDNTFAFSDGAALTGSLTGGSGNNTLDTSAYSSNESFSITGANAGGASVVPLFSNIQNLVGGAAATSFGFSDGGSLAGTLNGGSGTATLDYSNGWSGDVVVNLQTGLASGVGGGVSNIRNVNGANGGGAGFYDILVGNGGNTLTGGNGRRNLLEAGGSASTLIGGNDDDILIGGTTAYDSEADAHDFIAIMNYWANTTDAYATRVSNLLSGTGVPALNNSTAFNNGGGNTMLGNNGGPGELNLFYGLDPSQENTDFNLGAGEQFINV